MKTLKESLFDTDLASKDIIYRPKTNKELQKIVDNELRVQGPDANLNHIDVSAITDMSDLFVPSVGHIDVSSWDVSNVEIFDGMFQMCPDFDADLGNWKFSKTKSVSMRSMFDGCKSFTGKGLDKWDVSMVDNMGYMFYGCSIFTGEGLDKWDVGKVEDMFSMFAQCYDFNCNLSKWNVRKVQDMGYMFEKCLTFKGEGLDKWKLSRKCDLSRMFKECNSLKKIPDWYKNSYFYTN